MVDRMNRFNQQAPVGNMQPNQNQNLFEQLNNFYSNPSKFLADKGISVPKEYQGSYEKMGRYLLNNVPQNGQNNVLQMVNQLMSMFGKR